MAQDPSSGPTQTATESVVGRRWESHPFFASAIRILIFLLPVIIAIVVSIWASRRFPPESVGLGGLRWMWWLGLAIASTLLVRVLERITTKVTPLAMLFRLSLIFPDQAPSRFSTALKTGSPRSLQRKLSEIQQSGQAFNQEETFSEQMLELVAVLAQHDRMTRGHAERVRAYSELIGEEMRLGPQDLGKLRWAALLHDMGKLHVPSEILNKPGRPDEAEWKILRDHPAKAEEYLEPLADWLGEWRFAAVGHHERWDGNGYPAGQTGTEIPLSARIVAVADAYDVMTSTRSYKKPLPAEVARQEIAKQAGSQFDPAVSRAFLAIGLGDLRRTAGPLAFLSNLPLIRTIPLGSGAATSIPAMAAAAATTAAVVGAPVDIPEPAPPPAVAFAEPSIDADDLVGIEDESILGSIVISGDGPFTVTVVQPPSLGVVALNTGAQPFDGAPVPISYTPDANQFGMDEFRVEACDSNNVCVERTISVAVNAVNDAPSAAPDSLATNAGESLTIDFATLLANDTDVEPSTLTVASFTSPDNGELVQSNDALVFTPDAGFVGTTTFRYTTSDGNSESEPATVTLSVEALPATTTTTIQPVAPTTTAQPAANTIQPVAPTTTAQPAAPTTTTTAQPAAPTTTTTAQPAPTTTTTQPVTPTTVTPPNRQPTLSFNPTLLFENSAAGTTAGTAVGTDPDGDTITFSITGGSGVGLFTIDPTTGSIETTGPIDFEASPQLTLEVTATDPDGLTAVQTVQIAITNINEAPVVPSPQTFFIDENPAPGDSPSPFAVLASDIDGDTLTYSLADPSNSFEIDATTGIISVTLTGAGIDFEDGDTYPIVVTVTDPGGLSAELSTSIEIGDVNESPILIGPFGSLTVAENSPSGTTIPPAFAGIDPEGDSLTFSIIDPSGLFDIDPATGQISVVGALNFEDVPNTFDVDVSVDDGSNFSTRIVTIEITDVPEAPSIVNTSLANVREDTVAGATVATLLATDDDGHAITWSIDGGTGAGTFAIDPATGEITLIGAIDFETAPNSYTLDITATDPDQLTDTNTFTIGINNVDEPPEIAPGQVFTIAEEQSPFSPVLGGTVAFTDPEGDPVTRWSIVADPSDNFIITTQGHIVSLSSLDFDGGPKTYDVVVRAEAAAGTSTETVTIEVLPVDEPPTFIADDPTAITVPELTPLGTTVGTLGVDNPEAEPLTFTILGGTGIGLFDIDPSTGAIELTGAIDFENGPPSYTLDVQVADADNPSLSDIRTVELITSDDPERAWLVRTSLFEIPENVTPGSVVTPSVQGIDPDGGAAPRFELIDRSGRFTIEPSAGTISLVAGALDKESQDTYPITINLYDDSDVTPLNDTWDTTITITDVNEAPDLIAPATLQVDEDTAIGTILQTLTTTDPDVGDTLTYETLTGSGATLFAIDPATGEIGTTAAFDFETTPGPFELIVTVRDSGGLSDSEQIIIGVGDVNDPPVIAAPATLQIPEDTAIGTVVQTLTTTDPDVGDTHTYETLTGSGATLFAIDPATGKIETTAAFDFETTPGPFELIVTVRDTDGLSDSELITITITDVNEEPVIDPTSAFSVRDDAGPRTALGTMTASDPDGDGIVAWQVVGGSGQGLFNIDSSGQLSLATTIDFDDAASYTLQIEATDDGSPALTSNPETITVNVTSRFGAAPSPFFGDIVFNEIRYSAGQTGFLIDGLDRVEIVNVGNNPLDLAGWRLSDHPIGEPDGPNNSWDINLAAEIPSGERINIAVDPLRLGTLLTLVDDLFLYDDANRLVAYMAWGNPNAQNSEIGIRPPINSWGLWDPTHEAGLTFVSFDSISVTPDGQNSTKSGCWERTGTGNAADCPGAPTTLDTDPNVNFSNSYGEPNTN